MYKIGLKYTLSAGLAGMVFSAFAITTPPELTLTALTDPSLAIPKGEVASIEYQLINHSNKAHQLTMNAVPGISQVLANKDSCGEGAINIEPGKKCILSLKVSANETIGLTKTGPLLCEHSDRGVDQEHSTSTQCIEPNIQERISVHELSADKASISVKVKLPHRKAKNGFVDEHLKRCFSSFAACTLTMFQDSDVPGELEITNTASVPIYALEADENDLPDGVNQDASQCELLLPGDSCTLYFYPGSTTDLGTTVGISGSNTGISYVTFQVLGLGDPYNGANELFQLPSLADLHFYTASTADANAGVPMDLATASTFCTVNDAIPEIEQLTELYDASDCNFVTPIANPITGFNCAGTYWSNTVDNSSPGLQFVFNFMTGVEDSDLNSNPNSYTRCVQGYVLVI